MSNNIKKKKTKKTKNIPKDVPQGSRLQHNMLKRMVKFCNSIKGEIQKVVWPERNVITYVFIMVIVVSIISALFFALVDNLSYRLVDVFITKFIA